MVVNSMMCARCGRAFEPDVNHVKIDGETKRIDDRNQAEAKRIDDRNQAEVYYMHEECWLRETEDWNLPA